MHLARIESKVERITECGCWIWTGATHKGYGQLMIDGKQCRAHRVAWELYNGTIPDGLSVLHRCDVSACVNPAHLFLGTQKDNVKDMDRKGRGNRHDLRNYNLPRQKLSVEDVVAIRSSSLSQYALAKQYGVSQPTISTIKTRKSWGGIV